MNRIIKTLFVLLLVSLLSCSKKPLQVNQIENTPTLSTSGVIYALPRTTFKVNVKSTKLIVVPGPYAKYAQKYLGVSDVQMRKIEEWKIDEVTINGFIEPDPNALYAASPGEKTKVDFLSLVKTGLIIPVNSFNGGSYLNSSKTINIDSPQAPFSDLSVTPFIATEKATFLTRVQKDSVFVKVPVQKEMVVEKSLEDKARDAADFIFSLRKRRSDFLSVDADHNLNGEGLKVVLEEIRRLEYEYLSLFIGKSFTETAEHSFDYLPVQTESESSILFRFSSTKGVLTPSDLSGNPVLIRIESEQFPDSYSSLFNSINNENGKPLTEVIYYRIPAMATIRVTDSKVDYLNYRTYIYQYGQIVRMPLKYTLKDNQFIQISQ